MMLINQTKKSVLKLDYVLVHNSNRDYEKIALGQDLILMEAKLI